MTATHHPATAPGHAFRLRHAQLAALWLCVASGWLVMIEPAPYEALFALAFVLLLFGGLSISPLLLPLVVFITLYNVGGLFSTMQVTGRDETRAWMFAFISIYMGFSALIFAMAVLRDPERVMRVLRNGWIVAGVLAGLTGIMGYFDIAGTGGTFTLYGRAKGAFKDPNVFATFLVPPAVFLVQGFMTGRMRHKLWGAAALLVILAGNFLAFSRGGWAVLVGSLLLLALFTFMTTRDPSLRTRIVLIAAGSLLAGLALVAFLLSFENIRQLFAQRFALFQPYDVGGVGRFSNQARSLPMLLNAPLGFGPHQFGRMFGEDPHNVYINAFSAYGWLGGVSYLLLIGATLWAGLRGLLSPSPWRQEMIAVYAPLSMLILQGLQIDTDHWRHFYLLLGILWGLFAAGLGSRACRLRPHQ